MSVRIRYDRLLVLAVLALMLAPALASVKDRQTRRGATMTTSGATARARGTSKTRLGSHRPVVARPTIKNAKAENNKVILENAQTLHKNLNDTFMIVSGDVQFVKGGMHMFCDSAHYSSSDGSFDAFGNVRMQQGDTLFVYADELNYDGPGDIAYLYGYERDVRMINRDVKLETSTFTYDLAEDFGYYDTGGVLTDRKNRLTSSEGEYIPSTKDANFFGNVHLNALSDKDTLDIYTDSLYYNTATHVADFVSPTRIINARGTIFSTDGTYATDSEICELFDHSRVVTSQGTTLEGDTLYYDRKAGYGTARGNMSIINPERKSALHGEYGYYNELTDSAYATGRAIATEYSQGDTLYMHGRQLTSVARFDTVTVAALDSLSEPTTRIDTTHVVTAWPRVRFWRVDMQGLCDSMVFTQRDSTLQMHRHPIVWSDERQIFGNVINVHLNDSTVDRADLPDFAFTAQKIEDDIYNQLTGREMTAYFSGGELTKLDVSGSVEAIFYPEESDSTINKLVTLQTSYLSGWFDKRVLKRMKAWPESDGTVKPLYLVRRGDLLLPKFKWYEGLRPRDPADILNIPPEMDELMEGSKD